MTEVGEGQVAAGRSRHGKPRVAIVGAGLTGAVIAQTLRGVALATVFEKARGAGGRLSTRGAEGFAFDHGASYFTIRTEAFRRACLSGLESGLIAHWPGAVASYGQSFQAEDLDILPAPADVHVAVPGMNALPKMFLADVPSVFQAEVARLKSNGQGQWILFTTTGQNLGPFDAVISTAPPVQTAKLFGQAFDRAAFHLASDLEPCFALMVGFEREAPWPHAWNRAWFASGPIRWIALNHTKPGRDPTKPSFVIHSSAEWATFHLEDPLTELQALLADSFERWTGVDVSRAQYQSLHRWRYARQKSPSGEAYFDAENGLFACGDWACGSRIEDVWATAIDFAERLVGIFR